MSLQGMQSKIKEEIKQLKADADAYMLLIGPVHMAINYLKKGEADKALKCLEAGVELREKQRGDP